VHFDRDRGKIDWNKKNAELKDAFFREHTLSTAKFRVSLEMGLRQKALAEAEQVFERWSAREQHEALEEASAALVRQTQRAKWTPEIYAAKARQVVLEHVVPGVLPQIRLPRVATRVSLITPSVRLKARGPEVPLWFTDEQGKAHKIEPDWPFTLVVSGKVGDMEALCFLETDRSTTTLETVSGKRDMLLKYRRYWSYWKQEQAKFAQGLPAQHMFRVLTTSRSERRLEHLREVARKADDKQSGSALFWFANEEAYTPDKPDSLWGSIWRTAKDDTERQLLE
jgi:hypothetical protein